MGALRAREGLRMKTTVEWPEGLTRERLMELADFNKYPHGDWQEDRTKAFLALAPIAATPAVHAYQPHGHNFQLSPIPPGADWN